MNPTQSAIGNRQSPIVSIIVAMARNRVIGRDGDLPWRMPADLRHFKATTAGHPMIMGRRTWQSIGSKPLPGRPAVVVTRQADYVPGDAAVAHDLDAALAAAGRLDGGEVFICGGEAIYREALDRDRVDRIYLTLIDAEPDGDTRFPEFDAARFDIASREDHPADEKNPHGYSFIRYERRPRDRDAASG